MPASQEVERGALAVEGAAAHDVPPAAHATVRRVVPAAVVRLEPAACPAAETAQHLWCCTTDTCRHLQAAEDTVQGAAFQAGIYLGGQGELVSEGSPPRMQ